MVSLMNQTNTLDSLFNVPIYHRSSYYSNKVVTKGSWYFEYTLLTGLMQCVIGYSCDSGEFALTVQNNTLSFFRGGDLLTDLQIEGIKEGYTAGIGLDISSLSFFIQYEHQSRVIDLHPYISNTNLKWNVVVRQRKLQTVIYDEVNISFDEQYFKYFVPFGFTPWANKFKEKTCYAKTSIKLNIIYFIFVITS